jgi:membrane-associated phospholipid phosphatase
VDSERVRLSVPAGRRWFAAREGEIAPPLERFLLLAAAYAIGGLGYLGVNRLVGDGPFHRLDLPIDHQIPYLPIFVFPYVLVYFTPALAAIFLRDRAELYRAFLAFGLNAAICFPIFLLLPVELPRENPIPDSLSGHLLAWVHRLDRPVNCFPSHHVSTAFTTFFAVRRQEPIWGGVFGVCAVMIAISTLFVKQHYLVDVPAGIGIACLTLWLSFPRSSPISRARKAATDSH